MNIAEFSIKNNVVTLMMAVIMLVGGMFAFQSMSRLEDPEFTIKDAIVITQYPGASAQEVAEEVTDELEKAIQSLGQVKEVTSKSERGLSTINVTIHDQFDKSKLPQVWDELRRKVSDAQSQLPPGSKPSLVVDDYGDVYGVFVSVYGADYDYAEIKKVTDMLKRELLLVQDVAKIDTFGERTEAIYIEYNRDRMSQLGLNPQSVSDILQKKNMVTNAGRVKAGTEYISIQPSGGVNSVKDFEQLLIRNNDKQQIYLKDIATVHRSYTEPQSHSMRYDGQEAIGLGISTTPGGNVVTMGKALEVRVNELKGEIPVGIEFGIISLQSDAVTDAISNFTVSLLQAVAIVVIVLLFFMGLRSGLLIGFILLITICGSFLFLKQMGVALERISLGALIIALGMLVDNAIVIVDGILMKLQRGVDPKKGAVEVVNQSAIPLLGATIIAILAFAAIGTSNDNTGEFCRSLFQVVMVSLLLSWITAVTITPLLGIMVLKAPANAGNNESEYNSGFYRKYKALLQGCIRHRAVTIMVVLSIFGASVWGFKYVKQSFFPPSTRAQLMVDIWLPQGTHINTTTAKVQEIESQLLEHNDIDHVSSLVGKGALRFLLTYTPEKTNSAYAQLILDITETSNPDQLINEIETYLSDTQPDVLGYASKFQLGPGSTGKVQARFSGPDPSVLRSLASQAKHIIRNDYDSKAIRTDWRQRVKLIRPVVAEEQANLNGITQVEIANTIKEGFDGVTVGLYRDGDLILPIITRADDSKRNDVASINNLQIWSRSANQMIPLRQVVSGFKTEFEDELLYRKDRKLTITVFADPITNPASELFGRVRPQIENIELPDGYSLEWGGEYEDSGNAQSALVGNLIIFIIIMIVITIALFNNLRQPLVIWLCVPLALIGATVGLLSTGQPFGFMALLGFLSLIGMLIKNAIVLIDQINLELETGKPAHSAIVESAVSRLRPVGMAASTTALGMIPLLFDAFFASMAVTIIAGLVFATVLTMVVLPVFYAAIYKVPKEA